MPETARLLALAARGVPKVCISKYTTLLAVCQVSF
jgi:hypothetical protein